MTVENLFESTTFKIFFHSRKETKHGYWLLCELDWLHDKEFWKILTKFSSSWKLKMELKKLTC